MLACRGGTGCRRGGGGVVLSADWQIRNGERKKRQEGQAGDCLELHLISTGAPAVIAQRLLSCPRLLALSLSSGSQAGGLQPRAPPSSPSLPSRLTLSQWKQEHMYVRSCLGRQSPGPFQQLGLRLISHVTWPPRTGRLTGCNSRPMAHPRRRRRHRRTAINSHSSPRNILHAPFSLTGPSGACAPRSSARQTGAPVKSLKRNATGFRDSRQVSHISDESTDYKIHLPSASQQTLAV